MKDPRPEPWLSVREVAWLVGTSVRPVKHIPSTELPYFRSNDRGDRKYRRADVRDYIERRMVR
jgi:hypothetical protein